MIDRPAGKLVARAIYRWEADEIGIALWTKDIDGRRLQIAQPVVFAKTDGPIVEPMLSLSPDMARELMDSMWAAGVRPTEQGSTGEKGALTKHLADMRALTFAKLGVKAPE